MEDFEKLIPGGVNSPVRSFAGVGDDCGPVFAASASGAWLFDTNGRRLVDYIHGWGSIIVGHAQPDVTAAIAQQSQHGLGYGITTEIEGRFAEELTARSGMQMARALNSGTEATMTAIRLARAHAGRNLLLKFIGCYHGHADPLLVAAGSGALTFGNPSSAGVPEATAASTIVIPYNDPQALQDCFAAHGDSLAGVIIEPVAGNMNLIVPSEEFMTTLANLCAKHGAVLISDEVMTGLRATPGLAIRDLFGIEPDLACLGKVIGGGLPVAAICGCREIMELLAPLGPVYQAGTLSGNPICLAAGLATLKLLDADGWQRLEAASAAFAAAMREEAKEAGIKNFCSAHCGGMAGFYFSAKPPVNLADVEKADRNSFEIFYREMLAGGVLLPPSRFEACFLGLAHDDETLSHSRSAMKRSFSAVAAEQAKKESS